MTRPSVVVLDYGSGNVHSAVKALELAGADVELTGDPKRAHEADGLLVPGVEGGEQVGGVVRLLRLLGRQGRRARGGLGRHGGEVRAGGGRAVGHGVSSGGRRGERTSSGYPP